MSAPNTWPDPRNERYYNYYFDQTQQTPSTSESSPITPQQYTQWIDGPSVQPPLYAPQPYLQPLLGVNTYSEEPEQVEFEAEVEYEAEQEEEVERTGAKRERQGESSDAEESEPSSPKKRRRRTGEDGDRKTRNSRACTVCRGFKAKCMPGPSMREPSESHPCNRCVTTGQQCLFTPSRRGKPPTEKFARLQKQLERMEHHSRMLDRALRGQHRSRHNAYPLI